MSVSALMTVSVVVHDVAEVVHVVAEMVMVSVTMVLLHDHDVVILKKRRVSCLE